MELADRMVRERKLTEALNEVNLALAREPGNSYALSFKERLGQFIAKSATVQKESDHKVDRIAQLLKNAEQCMQHKQFKLALQEIAKVYAIDPQNHFARAFSDRVDQLMAEHGQFSEPPSPLPEPTRFTSEALQQQARSGSHQAHLLLYVELLKEFWMDGMLNEQEQQELKKVRDAFGISQEEHARLSRQVHMDAYIEALRIAWRDGLVSNNEEQVLQTMRRKFNITPEEHMSAEAHILWAKTAPNAKGTILVVDDEKTILLPLSLRLKRHGYTVLTAESVEAAIALAESSPPSLILSDLMFPTGMSGLEFYEAVRKNPALKDIPFLLMSGIKDEFIIRAGLRLGIDSFLAKPFNLETLLAIIEGKLSADLQP